MSQVRNAIISSRLLPILLTFLTSFLRSYLLFFLLTFLVPLLPSYLPHFLPSPLPSVYLTDLPYPSCHDESLFYSTSHSLISITPKLSYCAMKTIWLILSITAMSRYLVYVRLLDLSAILPINHSLFLYFIFFILSLHYTSLSVCLSVWTVLLRHSLAICSSDNIRIRTLPHFSTFNLSSFFTITSSGCFFQ